MDRISELARLAADPDQYASVRWEGETGLESPTRRFHYDGLAAYRDRWTGARILDAGCGTGWLVELARLAGAAHVEGYDPCAALIAAGRTHFPEARISQARTAAFAASPPYDLIFSVMTLGHEPDLPLAFDRFASWLGPKGEVHVMVAAYENMRTPRFNYRVDIVDLDDETCLADTWRPHWGRLVEYVRKPSAYMKAAAAVGLVLREAKPLKPTERLIATEPRYAHISDRPITVFLRFAHPA